MTRWPRLTQPDDHVANMRLMLSALPADVPRRGVVHVGAHRGEEVPVFREAGFRDVLLIEANPEHVSELEEILAHDRNVRVLGRAVGASEGTATLLVHTSRTGSTEPASLLPLGEFKEIVATLHTPRTVEVPLTTLDALARDGSIDVRKYNLLLVDVQGAERLVFAGAHESLRHFDAIVTEVNMRPLYVGGALEDELLTDLAALGFAPMFSIDHELYRGDDRFIAWGECLLVRRRS